MGGQRFSGSCLCYHKFENNSYAMANKSFYKKSVMKVHNALKPIIIVNVTKLI